MAISKSKKDTIVKFLKDEVSSQKSLVLVTTSNTDKTLDAGANFDLRSKSYHQGVKVQVVKNSLISKSFPAVKDLAGQTYLAYLMNAEDTSEVAVPKTFIKLVQTDFKDNFKVVGAIINGEFVDANEAIKYSNIPSKDESLAMIAGAINQIAAGVARAVKAVSEKE
jgi:ribosomal protein L10